jgi:protein-disulfide isomerase
MKIVWANCLFVILFTTNCLAQSPPNGDKLDSILDELRQIHKLLESRPALPTTPQPKSVRIEVGKTPILGSKNAPFTMVEFTDYQCKFCQQFYDNTFKDIKKLYIDTGKLQFYSMDLPLVEIHPAALVAAQAGHCAADQNKFWPMYDKMKSNVKDLEIATLVGYAQGAGLDMAAFRECVESGRYKKDVETSVLNAKAKGVRGTPSFVIGKSADFGVEGEPLTGALPLNVFEKKFKEIGLDK